MMLFALFTGIYFTMIATMIRRGLNRDSIISFEVFSSRVKPETKKIFEFQILPHRKVNLQSVCSDGQLDESTATIPYAYEDEEAAAGFRFQISDGVTVCIIIICVLS